MPSKVPSSVGICDHIVPAKPLGEEDQQKRWLTCLAEQVSFCQRDSINGYVQCSDCKYQLHDACVGYKGCDGDTIRCGCIKFQPVTPKR